MGRRGLTLAEAVVAVFVLLSSFLVMSRLFMTGVRYQTLIETQQNAIFLAEAQIEAIRGWSAQQHQPVGATPFSDWSSCPGSPGPITNPAFPGYSIAVNSTVHELYSPCSLWELQYPDPLERRRLAQSTRRVRVTVNWSNQQFFLESLVATPVARLTTAVSAQVSPSVSTSIAQGNSGVFSAQANGPGGVLPDVLWTWYSRGVGDGSLVPRRDGAQARVHHYLLDAADPPNITGYGIGEFRMRAVGRVRGKEVVGESGLVTLP